MCLERYVINFREKKTKISKRNKKHILHLFGNIFQMTPSGKEIQNENKVYFHFQTLQYHNHISWRSINTCNKLFLFIFYLKKINTEQAPQIRFNIFLSFILNESLLRLTNQIVLQMWKAFPKQCSCFELWHLILIPLPLHFRLYLLTSQPQESLLCLWERNVQPN